MHGKMRKQLSGVAMVVILTAAFNIILKYHLDFLYFREALGLLLATIIPGYPISHLVIRKEMGIFERIMVGFGIGIVVTFFTVLSLNFTPIGITESSLAISLSIVTLLSCLIVVINSGYETMKMRKRGSRTSKDNVRTDGS